MLPPPLYRYHPSAFPPVLPCLPHPPYRPSLRHPLWCPPNQPPTRSLVALPPAAAAAATAAVAPPPRPCRLSTHRPAKPLVAVPPSHPTYRLPHYPAASDPHPSPLARQPPACRLPACLPADSSSLCATLRSLGLFSLPTAVPRCGPRPFLSSPLSCHYLATPGVTPFGQPAHPKAVRCGTRQAAPRLSFVRSYVARVCVRENAKGMRETEKGCARGQQFRSNIIE